MAEECADCGASFGSAAELVIHMKKSHEGGDPKASMEMNPESQIPGLECAACGQRFSTRESLAAHNLHAHEQPHPARPGGVVST
jgi:Zinc finger, C2H2 type